MLHSELGAVTCAWPRIPFRWWMCHTSLSCTRVPCSHVQALPLLVIVWWRDGSNGAAGLLATEAGTLGRFSGKDLNLH